MKTTLKSMFTNKGSIPTNDGGVVPSKVVDSGRVESAAQHRRNSRDSPSKSSGPESKTSVLKGAVISHPTPGQQKPDNSSGRQLRPTGPESLTQRMTILRTALNQHPKQQKKEKPKKKSIWKKLFGCCLPFFRKRKSFEQPDKPLENKHITRVKYGPQGVQSRQSLIALEGMYSSGRQPYYPEINERKIKLLEDKGFEPRLVDGVLRYTKTKESEHISS